MFLKPSPGMKVRFPATMRLLAEEGEEVQPDQFWERCLRDGDVVYATKPAAVEVKKEEIKPVAPATKVKE